MKSPSIDSLYTQINKHVLLTESYTEISGLASIIKSCRLKPYSYIMEEKSNPIKLYKWWFDEFGNSLNIIKNKNISLTFNDLKLPKDIVCTDLYYGLSINKIIKISKSAMIFAGKDEDSFKECLFISLLGIDNYIRSYMFMHDKWKQVASLPLGIDNLRLLVNSADIKYFQELKIEENFPMPCISRKAWLTYLPISDNFFEQISKEYEIIGLLNLKGIK